MKKIFALIVVIAMTVGTLGVSVSTAEAGACTFASCQCPPNSYPDCHAVSPR